MNSHLTDCRPLLAGTGGVITYTAAFGWEVWFGIFLALLLVATLEAVFEGDISSVGFRLYQVLGNLLMECGFRQRLGFMTENAISYDTLYRSV